MSMSLTWPSFNVPPYWPSSGSRICTSLASQTSGLSGRRSLSGGSVPASTISASIGASGPDAAAGAASTSAGAASCTPAGAHAAITAPVVAIAERRRNVRRVISRSNMEFPPCDDLPMVILSQKSREHDVFAGPPNNNSLLFLQCRRRNRGYMEYKCRIPACQC